MLFLTEPLTCTEDGEEQPHPDPTCSDTEEHYSCQKRRPLKTCKCDDDCVLFEDCCHDAPGYSDQVPVENLLIEKFLPYMKCESILVEWFLSSGNSTSLEYYNFISSCPDYVPRESIVRLYCEEYQTAADVFHTPMMVESIGHFKNIYCAMCHGVDLSNIKEWKGKWRCDDDLTYDVQSSQLDDLDYTEENLIKRGTCSRALEEPEDRPEHLAPRTCTFNISVTTCPMPYPEQPDTEITCPSYLAPVKHNGTIYKNLACAKCNGIDVCNKYVKLCESMRPGVRISRRYFPSLAEYFSFSPDTSTTLSCALNEAFDPLTRICQVVYCLSGFVYNDTTGTCERLPVDEVGGVCLSFESQSNRETEVNVTSNDLKNLVDAMNSLLMGSPYDLLTDFDVLDLLHVSCNRSEIQSYDQEGCFESNGTISTRACQACFEIALNFSALIESNISAVFNASSWIDDAACYFTPSFGNVSVTEIEINVPADWTCASYSSFFKGKTNETLLPPFRLEITREAGAYEVTSIKGEYICRNISLQTCKDYFMADPGQFEYTDDSEDSIRLQTDNRIIENGEFERIENGSVLYCRKDSEGQNQSLPEGLDIMTMVGTILSMVSVLAVITTYVVFPKLRNMAGKSILALSVALLMVFVLMCLAVISSNSKGFCKAMSAASHFFWLSIFFWMNALAIDLNRTFGSRAKIRVGSKSQIFYIWYSLYSWGTPALIVGACLTIDLCECTDLSFEYGREGLCWLSSGDANLYGFGVPLAALLFFNIILFSDTVVGIRLTKKASEKALKERPALARAKEELSLYIKLSSVMGFTWIFCFVCEYANVPELWYIFTAVNSLQGVFVFLAFGLNKRVIALWKEKLGITRKDASSSQGDSKSTNTKNSTINNTM
ncbi:uncharacterized protein LOC121431172 [Lytechinus variegatus]|uniref:uncharacterized protein LOC121431172 n=1 Tax=Lytechinus variegatus TaxID=7654 RepID=UPI001BB13E1D|nr:uncharacterized protein LOC121431172 [Lytechinus variegatus]